MKIECLLEKLKDVVPQIDRVTGKNLTLPILNSILLVASGKTLKLRSTNLDLGIEIEIQAKIQKEGIAIVSGNLFNSIIISLNNSKNVNIETIQGNLEITTESNKTLLKTYPEDDFPTIPVVSGEDFFFEIDKIISALKSVSYSASISDIKPEISSVYIYENNGDLVFVATDSFRLGEKRVKLKKPQHFNGIIIPIKNVLEIIRIFDGKDGEFKLSISKNQISFSYNNIYLTSRLIDGVFPDYKQIIPKESKTEVIILKQDIINSLKSAAIFSGKFNEINILVNPKDKILEINTKNQELGENNTKIEGNIKGEKIEANFNYKYIYDSFQSIHEDSIFLSFTSTNKPLVIRGINDKTFLYLVMPMNR